MTNFALQRNNFCNKIITISYFFFVKFMNTISIITDRKTGDFFLGRLKGYLHKHAKGLTIIDFASGIENFNINITAFILRNGFRDFPDNTIHIVGVDSEITDSKSLLAVKACNHWFITADNGLVSLIFEPEQIDFVISFKRSFFAENKPSMFYFADLAIKIISGDDISPVGNATVDYRKKIAFKPTFGANFISANIIYFDSYKNAITNIDKKMFDEIGKGRKFVLFAGSKKDVIKKINTLYNSVEPGELTALFNSYGMLEIAVNSGNIGTLLNLRNNSIIRIEFYD